MRAYLFVSGSIFGLFAVMHFYIAWEHWQRPGAGVWMGLAPALIGVFAGALAAWAFRLGRPRPGVVA